MARNVAGDAADVESLTKPGAEIHYYQPTPGDILRARGRRPVLWNGLNLEQWFEQFLDNLGDVPSAVLTEGVEPMGIAEGPYAGKANPHAWMSPDGRADLRREHPQGARRGRPGQRRGLCRERRRLRRGDPRLRRRRSARELAAIPEERRWLVSSEGAFSYLARDFGLDELYIWPINADQQGTPQQMRKVIDAVREHDVPAVFSESTVPADAGRAGRARDRGAYGGVLYVDSLSEPDGPVPTYLDLLRVTPRPIAEALAP